MYDVNELAARLRNGETIDDIANELAAALNKANAVVEEEQAAKKKAEAEAKQRELEREAQLDSLADIIIDSNINYIKIAAPDLADFINDNPIMTTQDFRDSVDAMIGMLRIAASMQPKVLMKDTKIETKEPAKPENRKKETLTSNDVNSILDSWIKTLA